VNSFCFYDGCLFEFCWGCFLGGFLCSCLIFLREIDQVAQPGFKAIAVEPAKSPVISGGRARAAQVAGHRRGLYSGEPEHEDHRRNHPSQKRRTPAGLEGGQPARRDSRGNFERRDHLGRRCKSQASRKQRQADRVVVPSSTERYLPHGCLRHKRGKRFA